MLHSIFESGAIAEGDAFFGYHATLNNLINALCDSSHCRRNYCGMNRIGKSSILKNAYNYVHVKAEGNPKWLVISVTMEGEKDSLSFWKNLLKKIRREAIKKGIWPIYLDEELNMQPGDESGNVRYVISETLFDELGVRLTLFIDEFDRAEAIFGVSDFGLLRTLTYTSSNKFEGMSLVLAHRLQMPTIERKVKVGTNSSLSGVMTPIHLRGFDDSDMNVFFQVFSTLYNFTLTDSQKEDIEFYCGRIPYFLSLLGNQIVNRLNSGEEGTALSIEEVFHTVQEPIDLAYKRIIENLEMDELMQDIMGYCFAEKGLIRPGRIAELESAGYILGDKERTAVSPYFQTILSGYSLEKPNAIKSNLMNIEIRLKEILKNEASSLLKEEDMSMESYWNFKLIHYKRDSRTGCELQEPDGPATTLRESGKRKELQRTLAANRSFWNNSEISVLDILSFQTVIDIYRYTSNWTILQNSFRTQPMHTEYSYWADKLYLCVQGRNCYQHYNNAFVSPAKQNELEKAGSEVWAAIKP